MIWFAKCVSTSQGIGKGLCVTLGAISLSGRDLGAMQLEQPGWLKAGKEEEGLAKKKRRGDEELVAEAEDRATKRISGLSAHVVLGIIALHTERAQQTDTGKKGFCQVRPRSVGTFAFCHGFGIAAQGPLQPNTFTRCTATRGRKGVMRNLRTRQTFDAGTGHSKHL